MSITNRPGLPAINYRVSTHATFLETMKARLSDLFIDVPDKEPDEKGEPKLRRIRPLRTLETRLAEDPAIAFLDAWALVADVLTFYQERIANEGYLRTATERRSIIELARLVGYTLRPGVASTVFLAYTIDEDRTVNPPKELQTLIPGGTRVQSVPGPGELPQSFETAADLSANSAWNNLQVRLTKPTILDPSSVNDTDTITTLYFEGLANILKPNDPLLLVFGEKPEERVIRRIAHAEPLPAMNKTLVRLQGQPAWVPPIFKPTTLDTLLRPLRLAPTPQRASAASLPLNLHKQFDEHSDLTPRLLTSLERNLEGNLYLALANAKVTAPPQLTSSGGFRVKAALFGHNAPLQLEDEGHDLFRLRAGSNLQNTWRNIIERNIDTLSDVVLDAEYDGIQPGSWILIEKPVRPERVNRSPLEVTAHEVETVQSITEASVGLNGRVTLLRLKSPWLSDETKPKLSEALENEGFLRYTTVHAQYEKFVLAEEPILECVGYSKDDPERAQRIELDRLHEGLDIGRWLVVSGERSDVLDASGQAIPGLFATELVMLADVEQGFREKLPNEKTHTTLILDKGLVYCYRRDTVKIWGNVAKATHGETRTEVLGSGDGTKALQQFTLRQPPLTFRAAATPSGVTSTLQVRVEDVLWHETDSLTDLQPTDHNFITRTDDNGKTTVIFGNGHQGARLPTGQENVQAVYRNGIGKSGNVKSEQITLLSTRPLGVKGVINPLRASGGAETESRDQARQNAPIGVMALDRLVSSQDYSDFVRSFAGVGKANSVTLSDGQRQLVHVTIAGVDDIPIDSSSDLYINLVAALHAFGDPHAPVRVDTRELLALLVSANVRVLSDYRWESVKPKIVGAMQDQFGFERRDLGQPVFLSEVISTIQRVAGVAYVDVDVLDTVSEDDLARPELLTGKLTDTMQPRQRLSASLARMAPNANNGNGGIHPAQLIFLPPDVPSTLILNEVTG